MIAILKQVGIKLDGKRNHQERQRMASPRYPREKKQELPSTYIVQDRSNREELIRLDEQDRLITSVMGVFLPEQEDPGSFQRVLDVGCGTGGWLINLAK